ncbi:MAG: hypothetical protein HY893_02095 [Deltaproteobacteria bacterium]|nr:hypothetical protein [Deltaproteobacteria bacterium]
MAQEALLKAIEEDAYAQTGRIVSEAEEAAKSIIEDAEKDVLRVRDERLKSLALSMERRKASSLNNARIQANGLKLSVRHGIIEEVLKEAVDSFGKLPAEDYSRLVNRLYDELKSNWPPEAGRPTVLVNPSDAGLIKAGADLMPDAGVSLGVVFTSKDGRVRFDNTVRSRIQKARASLVTMINGMITG